MKVLNKLTKILIVIVVAVIVEVVTFTLKDISASAPFILLGLVVSFGIGYEVYRTKKRKD